MKKYRDDVCKIGKCVNVEICQGLCPPLLYVNGKSKSKELLLSNLVGADKIEYQDYNEKISELAEDREIKAHQRQEKLENILLEPNSINKFVKLAILAGYPKTEVAEYCHLSRFQIHRIIKKAPR